MYTFINTINTFFKKKTFNMSIYTTFQKSTFYRNKEFSLSRNYSIFGGYGKVPV